MQYYQAVNYGYGFITHEDNEISQITGWLGDVWTTENNKIWADRVGATELSKEEAQIICDACITELRIEWQNCMNNNQSDFICGPEPQYFILP